MLCKGIPITMEQIKDEIFKESKHFSVFYSEFLLKDAKPSKYYQQTTDMFRINIVEEEYDALICRYTITGYTKSEKEEIIDYINTLKFEQYR